MLKQRIITALVLLAILLPAVFYPDTRVFILASSVLIAAGAWEWAHMNQCGPRIALAVAGLTLLACGCTWAWGGTSGRYPLLWAVVGLAWVISGVGLLWGGVGLWSQVPRLLRLSLGVLALGAAWLAVVQARVLGVNFLVSTLVLVWIADVFAYFAGRSCGGVFFKRKLAPSISPGKTWEGAIGGFLGVLVGAFVWQQLDAAWAIADTSIFTRLAHNGTPFMFLCVGFMAVMSVVGDLVESLFKRSAGVKDSSGLLPGHGGVLDRLDALLPVLPLAMMFTSL
ncbi:MAG: phosphatidate cytidylyltransferase [Burkholderiales bacterium PBB4]|nr:MAG: phosphatidate cytidylyltransferase [Burkholderiales bacterium PBB4]